MQVRRLSFLLVLSLLLSMVAACEDARADDPFATNAPATPSPPSARPSEADSGAAGEGLRVGGLVFTDEGAPIEGRPIALVDARGKRVELLSDEGGGFWFLDVKPPYDLAVAAAPSGVMLVPTVFLGLTTAEPHIELYEREGTSSRPSSQTIRVGVRVPSCDAPPCSLSVVTASASGAGSSAASYGMDDPDVVVFEIEHAWSAPIIAPSETIDVHVLTADSKRTAFSYVHRGGLAASPGDVVDLGTIDPAPIAASDPLEVRAVGHEIPAGWTTVLSTWIDMPGGGAMPFTYGTTDDATMHLPVIRGGMFRANAWMQRGDSADDAPYAYEGAQAWSGVLAVAGGTLSLDLTGGPAPARPLPGGTMSRRSAGVGWVAAVPGSRPLTEVTMTNVAHGSLRWRVFTNDDEVPNAHLERLGLRPLEPGQHVLGLTTTPKRTVDELVSADPWARHARIDVARAGSESYRRFAFTVTQ